MTPDLSKQNQKTPTQSVFLAGLLVLIVIVVCLCLIPKAENDLFFELRIGTDILHRHHVPHTDTYSWVRSGTRWVVPEWGTFALLALSYQAGGYFGTWLLMVILTVATAGLVWAWLGQRIAPLGAFVLTNLMLLAMNDVIQERPYFFTYLFLALALMVVSTARNGNPKRLLWLPPLCVLWTNLHQGVVVLPCLLLVAAIGHAITGFWQNSRTPAQDPASFQSAGRMLGTAIICALAIMISPYGWWTYWNVWVTLHDPVVTSNVVEWKSILVLPLAQLQPFLWVCAVTFGALALSRRRNLTDALMMLALFAEALLHARNIALFAIGSIVLGRPHFESALSVLGQKLPKSPYVTLRNALIGIILSLYVLTIALVSVADLQPALGPLGTSAEGIGEAAARVPSYPQSALDFVQSEGFPPNLRLLNNFPLGGFLMWRLPSMPVFTDGRLDVYVGQTFDDMLVLSRGQRTVEWNQIVAKYDFDCVITTSAPEASAFTDLPDWQLVYADPKVKHKQRCRIFLRKRPQFAGLIDRCLRAGKIAPG